jgi:hypothetical protein
MLATTLAEIATRRTWAAVLTGVAEVRNRCGDTASRCAFQCINHQDQFHQVVVGWRAGRLQNEDVFTADVFVDFDHDFAVREFRNVRFAEGMPRFLRLPLPTQD